MRFFVAALVTIAFSSPAWSLTKAPRRITDSEDDRPWSAARSPCTVQYYNYCSGWIWTWSGFPPESRLGIGYGPTQDCTDYAYNLEYQWILTLSPAPSGYGYTGTIALEESDPDYCPPGLLLASQPFLPIHGWSPVVWGFYTPACFTTIVTTGSDSGDPTLFVTDAPSTAPCRPPLNRTHSFTFGTKSLPSCPGQPFADGGFAAELLWDAGGNLVDLSEQPVSVETTSWGRVKAMFR